MQHAAGWLGDAVAIAEEAADVVRTIYTGDFNVYTKKDRSPLTCADVAAHRLIKRRLAALAPACPVLSEESSQQEMARRHGWQRFWLVDPLDGTREFVERNGEFTVNIALIENAAPVLGVIAAPTTRTLWYASRGHGAWRRCQGHVEKIAVAPFVPGRAIRVVGSRSHGRREGLAPLLAGLGAHEWQAVGSSLKFCRIAEGLADCYPRPGPTCEWDTGAAQIILEEAGGCVRRLEKNGVGRALDYNRRETLINPDFIALGDVQIAALLTDFHKRN